MPPFSKKMLGLSLLFLLVNLAWFLVLFWGGKPVVFHKVAPELRFASSQDVQIKTVLDPDFIPAVSGQTLMTGTQVKTGPQSFAEIQLSGSSVRLAENTAIELTDNAFDPPLFYSSENPRLTFQLLSGSVEVRAVDALAVTTPASRTVFVQGTGTQSITDSLNHVVVTRGSADLFLENTEGKDLARFLVPFRHAVTFADSQITPVYARLETSKLAKELKLESVSPEGLADSHVSGSSVEQTGSDWVYPWTERVNALRGAFTFSPSGKRRLALDQIQTRLNALLGGVSGPTPDGLKALALPFKNDPELQSLLASELGRLISPAYGSVAWQTRQVLRDMVFPKNAPVFLRAYLGDLQESLDKNVSQALLPQIHDWQGHWTEALRRAHPDEFERQARLLFSLLQAYPEALTPELLAAFESLAPLRIGEGLDTQEAFLALFSERLDLVSALTEGRQYPLAKSYLRDSYSQFQKAQGEAALLSSTQDLFLKRAELLFARIDFAESSLHGAAGTLDESKFQDYLTQKSRDATLSADLQSLLNTETSPQAASAALPTVQEVTDRFARARISLDTGDVKLQADSPYLFSVQNARLLDRAPDGSFVVFSASYDYLTNGVQDLSINGRPFRGNFELKDLVSVLTQAAASSSSKTPLSPDLLGDTSDESHRAETQAKDLATQLVLEAFTRAGIDVGSSQVTLLDLSTLHSFHAEGATVRDPDHLDRSLKVSFNFDLSTKSVSQVAVTDRVLALPATMALEDFAHVLFQTALSDEAKNKLLSEAVQAMTAKGFSAMPATLSWVSGTRFRFDSLPFAALPGLTLQGVFDFSSGRFAEAHHALLSQTDTDVDSYMNALGQKFILDFLTQHGVPVAPENLIAAYPFEAIGVKGLSAHGQLFDFGVNLKASQLLNVTIEGNPSSAIPTMTFEEFAKVLQNL